jgi:hypothetical protein
VAELKRLGYDRTAVIGTVEPQSNHLEPIRLVD